MHANSDFGLSTKIVIQKYQLFGYAAKLITIIPKLGVPIGITILDNINGIAQPQL